MKTYPVYTGQAGAIAAALIVMPWLMTGVNALAASWNVPLPANYESQLNTALTGVFGLIGAWWATKRVLAPTLTLPLARPDAE